MNTRNPKDNNINIDIAITNPNSDREKNPHTKQKPPGKRELSSAERNASIARARSLRRNTKKTVPKQKKSTADGIFSEKFAESHQLNRQDDVESDIFTQLQEEKPSKSPDELVAEIIEEIASKSSDVRTDGSAVQRNVDALVSEVLRPTEEKDTPPQFEENRAEILAAAIHAQEKNLPPEEPEATEKVIRTVTAVPISPEEDPLAGVRIAEIAQKQEKQRKTQHAAEMRRAAEEYLQETERAQRVVRKMTRKSNRQWKKEAAQEHLKTKHGRIEQFLSSCNFGIFLVMLFGIAVGMLVLERPVMSETENRYLAKMPVFSWDSYKKGDYTEGVAQYYNDTVPFRDIFKDMAATFRQHMGLRGNATLHSTAPTAPQKNPTEETTLPAVTTVDPTADVTLPVTATTAATTAVAPKEEAEVSNDILIVDKRGIMLYGGSYAIGESYAASLNKFQEQLGSGVQVYSMVVPTPCSYYTPEKFQYLIGSEKDNIQHINENLVGVKPIDVYGALQKHKDEPIFMRTDHHWSSLGAFYAAELFSAEARVPFAPMSEYDKVTKPGYVGTLYGFSGDITLKNNPEDFFYYIPHASYTTTYRNTNLSNPREGNLLLKLDNMKPVSWYLVYMGTDEVVTQVDTEVKNGRTLAIFKDSYGNALVPWFTSSFEHIYVLDIRYFQVNAIQYLQDIGATDVLFAMNTFSATGVNCKKIEQIRTQ